MTNTELCKADNCGQVFATSLEGEPFCLQHFIATCYTRLDQYDAMRKGPGLDPALTEAARRFIHESSRLADELEHSVQGLDNLDRAKLLHIILTGSELGRHLRRSPRKAAAFPVHLRSERLGATWEEDTETVLVSRHGALVRCKHTAKAGETLHFVRADTGKKATARVAWQRLIENDGARIGVEFVTCDNFWGLDWAAVEEAL